MISKSQVERNALPREIFRADVEPKRGGKVPEAAKSSQRIELNKLDAVGLDRTDETSQPAFFQQNSLRGDDFFQAPFSSGEEDYSLDFPYSPAFDPIKISGSSDGYQELQQSKYTNPYAAIYDSLFKKPTKSPVKKSSKDTYKYIDLEDGNLTPQSYNDPYSYNPPPSDPYYSPPVDNYGPDPYNNYEPPPPAYQEPAPYDPPQEVYTGYDQPGPPGPAQDPYDPYYAAPAPPSYEAPEPVYPPKPVGPVLLEKRPYEVKSVQPLPITVAETYTSFDCRSLYPGRHYADPETGCQVSIIADIGHML